MKSISILATAAAVAAGATAGGADAQTAQMMTQAQFVGAVDQCLKANQQTEFDTPADVVARIGSSCSFTAIVRFSARGHPVLGDALRYDPAKQQFVWNILLGEQNRFYGGGASPYALGFQMDEAGRPIARSYPADVKAALGDIGNANFVLIPLFRTAEKVGSYKGSNAFGATRTVAKTEETRYGVALKIPKNLANIPVLEVAVEPEKARQIANNLDVVFTFRVNAPCPVCYKADTLQRGESPTIDAPIDANVTTHFVYAEIVRFDVIDRVTGRVGYSAGPAAIHQ